MTRRSLLAAAVVAVTALVLAHPPLRAADPAGGETIELFNGKDLTGWKYKTGDAFDGKTEASDGRYSAKDGMIVVNPATEANKGTHQLWTVRQFPKDFTLTLEFRAAV